jgi:hypothetical protein
VFSEAALHALHRALKVIICDVQADKLIDWQQIVGGSWESL